MGRILYKKKKVQKAQDSMVVNTPGISGFKTASQVDSIMQGLEGTSQGTYDQIPQAFNMPVPNLELVTTSPPPPPPPKSGNGWMSAAKGAAGIAGGAALSALTAGNVANNNQALIGATQKGAIAKQAGASAVSGFASGFASSGIIGGAIGGVSGLVSGLFKGKKNKTAAQEQIDANMEQREEQEDMIASTVRNSNRGYNARKTSQFASQADSMYNKSGKQIGIAKRGKRVSLPITPGIVRKAYKGAKVQIERETDNTIVCSKHKGVCELMHKSDSPVHQIVFRRGGSIVNKSKRNIIPHGVLHEEENSTGVNGDKGIPIVKNGEKIFELEKSEWVLNSDISHQVQGQVYKYLESKDDNILIDIGRTVRRELLLGTYSYDDDYAYLNH